MADFYLFLVIVLFTLAIADLVVGVSNDAVNFLNSAIGSRVAPRYIIMIVASLGIFVGATFSSGIMEVARKGIFNPEFFAFPDVMIIFVAVMLTDIILLDFFNTLGLPTSTTVSIVFELLGAAVVMALIKISANGLAFEEIGQYINSSRALIIIAGIFLSIVFAFLVGLIIQFMTRLIFSFQFNSRMKYFGAIWCGLALTAMTYFMVIKGVKGASFVSKEQIAWFQENSVMILLASFVFWTIVLQSLLSVFKVNIFKIIVLFGTFGLAMAFAGNDLVNFIGVPIAGFESFMFWKDSNVAAEEFMMSPLSQPVQTPTYMLLIAGLVMVVTLWLSKKARSVTETEVNLSRQSEGFERFSPNALSRGIVRTGRKFAGVLLFFVPKRLAKKAENSFRTQTEQSPQGITLPAFDMIRASVNLTVASVLIAFATSLKLPLSTTYVSFMVAMGTSLADRAWERDSAVYRVSGVLSVIAGWFMTALIAFTVAGAFAFLIYTFELYAVIALLFLGGFLFYRGIKYHRVKEREKKRMLELEFASEKLAATQAIESQREHVIETLSIVRKTYKDVIRGVVTEKRKLLKKSTKDIEKLSEQYEQLKRNLFSTIKRLEENADEISKIYLKVYGLERALISSINVIGEAGLSHVENSHKPLHEEQEKWILEMNSLYTEFVDEIISSITSPEVKNYEELLAKRKDIDQRIEYLLGKQVEGIQNRSYSSKNTMLAFNLLMETKELVSTSFSFIKFVRKVQAKSMAAIK